MTPSALILIPYKSCFQRLLPLGHWDPVSRGKITTGFNGTKELCHHSRKPKQGRE